MKVTIDWRRTVEGSTVVDTDDFEQFDDWLTEMGITSPTVEDAKSFIENGEVDEWANKVRPDDAFVGSDQYEIHGIRA